MEEIRNQTPAMPRPLPGRRVVDKSIEIKNITDVINIKEIQKNGDTRISSNLYIDNFRLFKDNIDLIKYELSKKDKEYIRFYTEDYEVAKCVEDNFNTEGMNVEVALIDDHEMKDRNYINTEEFEKTKIFLPMSYLLWMKDITKDQFITNVQNKSSNAPQACNMINIMSCEELKRVKEVIKELESKCKDLSDLEKIIVVSNYIQSRTQFTEENGIAHADHVYVIDTKDAIVDHDAIGSGPNVILNKFGLCCGISSATTLLLNNENLRVNAHNDKDNYHIWNYVKLGDKWYYIDNTWNITRNKNRYPESLKAKEFSDEYLLFGTDKASVIGHHDSLASTPLIEKDDYNREEIDKTVKKLSKDFNFTDYPGPVFESRIKR